MSKVVFLNFLTMIPCNKANSKHILNAFHPCPLPPETGKGQCLFSEPPLALGEAMWHSCGQWCCSPLLPALQVGTGTENCSITGSYTHKSAHYGLQCVKQIAGSLMTSEAPPGQDCLPLDLHYGRKEASLFRLQLTVSLFVCCFLLKKKIPNWYTWHAHITYCSNNHILFSQ